MIGTRSLGRDWIALRDLPSADAQTRRAKLWFSQTTFYERYDLFARGEQATPVNNNFGYTD